MNKDLLALNLSVRKTAASDNHPRNYTYRETNNSFHIAFKSKGCPNYFNGSCTMCYYGTDWKDLSPDETKKAFNDAISKKTKPIKILFICSYGSIMDDREFSEESFKALINEIKKIETIKTLIIETHYETISKTKLEYLKNTLPNIYVTFEMGFETADPEIRKKCLLKNIDNNDFSETIKLIHSYKMGVLINILVGIPFLTPEEQLSDALKSIEWGIENKVNEIVLFPINVKKDTVLYKFYQTHAFILHILRKD